MDHRVTLRNSPLAFSSREFQKPGFISQKWNAYSLEGLAANLSDFFRKTAEILFNPITESLGYFVLAHRNRYENHRPAQDELQTILPGKETYRTFAD